MNPVLLTAATLSETQLLAASLFPCEHEHQVALAASVAPDTHWDFYLEHKLADVRFWTHLDEGRVSGLAGLYQYAAQPDEAWLAWYGLHVSARGRGRGAELLRWIVAETAAQGKSTLRLWTTDEAEYSKAIALYQLLGFRMEPWAALPGETWRTFVFSLGLDGQAPALWSERAPFAELCGRESPHLVAA